MGADALLRCVGDAEAFAANHWGRAPMLRRGAGPFDDLLDVSTIEALLTDLGRRPTFRLVRDGTPVPVADYTVRTRVGGTDIDDVANVDRILELLAGGATLVMQGLQRFWAPLARFCLELEVDLGHAVQANAYLSPPSAAGLNEHADDHDVLVLQVGGAKQWDIQGLGDVTLRTGDVIYLPAGTHHAARTSGFPSLHITLGILTTTVREVLRRTLDAIDDAELDQPLPIGYTRTEKPRALVDQLRSGLESAARHLAEADPAEVAAGEIARRRRRARRRWTGRLAAVVDPTAIDDATIVRRRGPFDIAIDGQQVVLTACDRRLRLPDATASALRCMLELDHVRVGELPGLDAADRAVLVRRLVREGILELVGPQPHGDP
jgi:lysine-specific demethylase/histidyl-hydroxylase NO66